MPQGEVVQEVRYQQVLNLAHQRQRFLSQTERVCHARHPLIKICFHRTGREDVAKRLLRMFRHRVSSQPKVIHVERQETEHQPFYFLPVLFIVGFRCAIVEAAGTVAARFLHGLDVAVQHGEELQRIHFLAFELDPRHATGRRSSLPSARLSLACRIGRTHWTGVRMSLHIVRSGWSGRCRVWGRCLHPTRHRWPRRTAGNAARRSRCRGGKTSRRSPDGSARRSRATGSTSLPSGSANGMQ